MNLKIAFSIFFFFFHPCLFDGMSSSRDEISSQQKSINSKRHFTIDRDGFVPEPISSPQRDTRKFCCLQSFLSFSSKGFLQNLLFNLLQAQIAFLITLLLNGTWFLLCIFILRDACLSNNFEKVFEGTECSPFDHYL